MRIVDSGVVCQAHDVPDHRRSCAFTTVNRLRDGTILVSGRWGSARDSVDGHACIWATPDLGRTWRLRYDGYGKGAWDGTPGEVKGLTSTERSPGKLTATALWVDRSDPDLPFIHPETQGLLPMRIMHVASEDGGFTWSAPRRMDTAPHLAASPCSHAIIRLPGGVLAQPYEQWKEYEDPSPGRPAARLRFSRDGGRTWPEFVTVARHPDNALAYWDQRLAIHPGDGRLAATFWTHDFNAGVDIDVHIAYGSPDGRSWTIPCGTGLPGQHCQPLALGGDRLLAAYPRRRDPPGIVLSISEDFGEHWDRERDLLVYDSAAGTESGAQGSRTSSELWGDMERWRFGHPRMVRLADGLDGSEGPGGSDNSDRADGPNGSDNPDGPGDEVFVVYYAGDDAIQTARWARVRV